ILPPLAIGRHQGHKEHQAEFEHIAEATEGHVIAGVPFRVYLNKGREEDIHQALEEPGAGLALRTVVEAFDHMVAHRKEFARFDEALTKGVLQKVIIVPEVKNREGKEFFLLVTRTAEPGQVQLLINASILEQQGYFNHPDQLVPVLAREFQWVVSKADTTPKRRTGNIPADPRHAPILSHQEIRVLSGEEREHRLQEIFRTYLTTTDRYESLQGLHFYEIGTTKKVPPAQPDSTAKLYDIRAREALQTIVRDPYFQEHTPKAVQSLLNGKIWNVAFVHIPERDWATRTRVVPEDQAIKVGSQGKTIQPAAVLVNIYRQAS